MRREQTTTAAAEPPAVADPPEGATTATPPEAPARTPTATGGARAPRLAYVGALGDEKATTAVGFLQRAIAFYRRHGIAVERVMSELNDAIAEATCDPAIPAFAAEVDESDRRRNERRSVVPDRRIAERRER